MTAEKTKYTYNSQTEEIVYRHSVMYGLIVVLLCSIIMVRFWPVQEKQVTELGDFVFQEEVLIDEMEITRQQTATPPPPRPEIPQPVPDDEIIEDDIDFDPELDLVDFPDLPEEHGTGRFGDDDIIVSSPQLPPSVIKIVEPSVPDLPNELRGRIEMIVNFLVNQDGTVEEASIVEIRKYSGDSRDEYEVLPFIQYGLMGATLEAALNWRFRAARHEGNQVRTYSTHRFNY